jgi:hypothetical protein
MTEFWNKPWLGTRFGKGDGIFARVAAVNAMGQGQYSTRTFEDIKVMGVPEPVTELQWVRKVDLDGRESYD